MMRDNDPVGPITAEQWAEIRRLWDAIPAAPAEPAPSPGPAAARPAAAPPQTRSGQRPRQQGDPRQIVGRFQTANAFADAGARLVSTTAQAAWWILWRLTCSDGLAPVSLGRLAACTGLSRRTAARAVKELKRAGLVALVRRGNLRGDVSVYRVYGVPPTGSKRGQ